MKALREIHKGHLTGYVYGSAEAMGQAAADYMEKEIIKLLEEKDEVNLMFSVGISQHTFHKALCAKRSFDWTRINLMLLDEKTETPQADRASCADRLLIYFRESGTPYNNCYFFDGGTNDPEAECERFAQVLREHEPDLAFIGIGINGHVAMNEPGEGKFDDLKDCKVVRIADRTKQSSVEAGYYARIEDMPKYGMTMTLPCLARIKRKFTIMPYPEKAYVAREVFCGEIRESLPATYVRMHDWTIFMDTDSAADITE